MIVSGLDQGVPAFRIVKRNNAWATENVWENKQVPLYMTNGVLGNDTLVGMSHRNSGQFFAPRREDRHATIWTGPATTGYERVDRPRRRSVLCAER